MPAIVPSQIVSFIDAELNYISREPGFQNQRLLLSTVPVCGALRALIYLIEGIPAGLLPVDPSDFGELTSSMESIRYAVAKAERQDTRDAAVNGFVELQPGVRSRWNPVIVIRQVLERCRDDAAPALSKDLLFIKDVSLRTELLADLTSARSALLNSEWKPATVIAGSLAEALLLWALDQKEPSFRVHL